jgi:hypothetical protein
MRVYSTSDISLADLRELGTELGSDFEIEVDERKRLVLDAWPNLVKSLKISVIVNPGVDTKRVSTLFLSGHCDAARHRH